MPSTLDSYFLDNLCGLMSEKLEEIEESVEAEDWDEAGECAKDLIVMSLDVVEVAARFSAGD